MSCSIESNGWSVNLDSAIAARTLPAFRTKAQALAVGRQFGWNSALRVKRRFETVWIVGVERILDAETIAGLRHREIRVPLLRWERRADGVEFCPTFTALSILRP